MPTRWRRIWIRNLMRKGQRLTMKARKLAIERFAARTSRACLRESGSQVAEAAFVLPILFLVLFGIVWSTLALSSASTLQRAAKQGVIAATRATCASCGDAFQSNAQVVQSIDSVLNAAHMDGTNLVSNSPAFACNATPAPACSTTQGVEICNGVPLTCGSAACQVPPQNCGSQPALGMRVSFGYKFNSPVPIGSWQSITLRASAQAQQEN